MIPTYIEELLNPNIFVSLKAEEKYEEDCRIGTSNIE